eukprot:m.43908 g.43908  ORF g.43908 m.43908 type:complete len:770 (-) comp6462_c0_seq1:95-2404(-)
MFRRTFSRRSTQSSAAEGQAGGAAVQPISIDVKTCSRIGKILTLLARTARSSRFDLPTRAPCLKDIVTDLHKTIDLIWRHSQLSVLQENDYFLGFLSHLETLCLSLQSIFDNAPAYMIACSGSGERARVLRYTLVLNHLCFELKSQFNKNGLPCVPIGIRLTGPHEFWTRYFQSAHVVPWDDFHAALVDNFGSDAVSPIADELRSHVDLCEDGRISWWEFDTFTHLFQPWDQILNTWFVLTKVHPGYMAWMTYEKVQRSLEPLTHKPGSYCYRISVTRPGQWAIGFVNHFGNILQALTSKSLYQSLIDGAADGTYRFPNGRNENIDPREHMPLRADQKIDVTLEDHEIYATMGSVFELCKICHTRNKNFRMEPCQHLICRQCYDNWNTQQRHNFAVTVCPFCRSDVQATQVVEVENRHTRASSAQQRLEPTQVQIPMARRSSSWTSVASCPADEVSPYQGGVAASARQSGEFANPRELEQLRRARSRDRSRSRASSDLTAVHGTRISAVSSLPDTGEGNDNDDEGGPVAGPAAVERHRRVSSLLAELDSELTADSGVVGYDTVQRHRFSSTGDPVDMFLMAPQARDSQDFCTILSRKNNLLAKCAHELRDGSAASSSPSGDCIRDETLADMNEALKVENDRLKRCVDTLRSRVQHLESNDTDQNEADAAQHDIPAITHKPPDGSSNDVAYTHDVATLIEALDRLTSVVIQHAPHVLDILEREDSFATQDFNDPVGVVSVSTIDSTTVSPYVVVPITHAIESVIHSASDM